jgi:hypothetical protein
MVLSKLASARLDLAINGVVMGEWVSIGSQEGLAGNAPLGVDSSQCSCWSVMSSIGQNTAEVISNARMALDLVKQASKFWAALKVFLRFSPKEETLLVRACNPGDWQIVGQDLLGHCPGGSAGLGVAFLRETSLQLLREVSRSTNIALNSADDMVEQSSTGGVGNEEGSKRGTLDSFKAVGPGVWSSMRGTGSE